MPTTLDIINDMLEGIGMAPVASTATTHPAVRKAMVRFNRVNTDMQARGGWYNESIVTLQPTASGDIYLPQAAVHASPQDIRDNNIVIRGNRLFNKETRSYNIGRPVKVKLIEVLPFDDLPAIVQDYIGARAVYEFYLGRGGGGEKLAEYKEAMQEALVVYQREDLKNRTVIQASFNRRYNRSIR